jgi:hypothetical protein
VTTTDFRPYAAAAGQGPAALYRYIRHCLGLRGGKVIDGTKCIWKTIEEAAAALGASERSVRRWFLKLVKLGWLKREKHAASSWYQAWFYALGDEAPLAHRGGQKDRTEPAKVAASYQGSTPPQTKTAQGTTARTAEQPKRKEPVPVPPQQGWPELDPQAAARAIAELRNQIPLLGRGRGRGFA